MRKIKYLAFNGKELVPVISLDSMKDGEPIVLVSEDGSGDLPLKNLGKVPVFEFTGRLDKAGAEIYNGAVVRHADGGISNIWYDQPSSAYLIGIVGKWDMYLHDIHQSDVTVIGHIQTTSELVK